MCSMSAADRSPPWLRLSSVSVRVTPMPTPAQCTVHRAYFSRNVQLVHFDKDQFSSTLLQARTAWWWPPSGWSLTSTVRGPAVPPPCTSTRRASFLCQENPVCAFSEIRMMHVAQLDSAWVAVRTHCAEKVPKSRPRLQQINALSRSCSFQGISQLRTAIFSSAAAGDVGAVEMLQCMPAAPDAKHSLPTTDWRH